MWVMNAQYLMALVLVQQVEPPSASAKEVQRLRMLLSGIEFEAYDGLVADGKKIFPVLEVILTDAKSDPLHVARAFNVLCGSEKADRQQFLKLALFRLGDKDDRVRRRALNLLEQIGSPADTAPIAVLLSDERHETTYAAAKTLSTIGGPNDLVALDVWLKVGGHREATGLREYVTQFRDDLKKRLIAQEKKSKK